MRFKLTPCSFGVVQTLFRVFRSWPRMLAKGIQLPPIIHLSQFYYDIRKENGGDVDMPKHIARCITLCKMWVGQAEDSGQIVQDAVRGEIEGILAKVCMISSININYFSCLINGSELSTPFILSHITRDTRG
jgi:hypothetical protein